MKQILNFSFFALVSILMISCGTNKKLTAANNQITELNNQLNACNASLAERDKQITQLKDVSSKNYQQAQDYKLAKEAADADRRSSG